MVKLLTTERLSLKVQTLVN